MQRSIQRVNKTKLVLSCRISNVEMLMLDVTSLELGVKTKLN